MHGGVASQGLRERIELQLRQRSSRADSSGPSPAADDLAPARAVSPRPEASGDPQPVAATRDTYIGLEPPGRPGETDVGATEYLFEQITRKLARTPATFAGTSGLDGAGNGNGDGDEPLNPAIPAGYAFLAQFAIHDLLRQGAEADLGDGADRRLLRTRPLALETLYGHGPAMQAGCYASAPGLRTDRHAEFPATRFRLAPADIGIGRATVEDGKCPVSIPLIADARNDDNAILSQFTALFQRVHNRAMDRLDHGRAAESPQASAMNFAVVRAALTHVYRRILRHDLLARLLDPTVRAYFEARHRAPAGPAGPGCATAADLAHAALRLGHAMIRARYCLSPDEPDSTPLHDILLHTPDRAPARPPSERDRPVAWGDFFDLPAGRRPQPSRRLSPALAEPLWDETLFPPPAPHKPAGLAYRDLLRCTVSGVHRIDALCARARKAYPDLAEASPWLGDTALRHDAMRLWIRSEPDVDFGEMEEGLVQNPPPVLYYLIEAAVATGGRTFGPLASLIVAESIFGILDAHPEAPSNSVVASEAAKVIFGTTVPRTMPELVLWLDDTGSAAP